MFKKVILFIFVISFFIQAVAQTVNTARLDSLFDNLAAHNKAMGSLAISKDGHVVYARSIGYSFIDKPDKKIAATSQTKYRIASISKMFTAAMIFQLVDEGKISLNTTLDNYFPQIPNARIITMGNMLNHRSGLQNFIYDTSWKVSAKTEGELLEMFANSKPVFEPGSRSDYSNTNYVLLGYILERIYKKSYADILQDKIVRRLGLEHTYSGAKTDPANNESYSYVFLKGEWNKKSETDMSILAGAGAIISTPTDLTQFINALFTGKLVSDSSLEKMKTITDEFGMGMIKIPFYHKVGYGYTGHIDGFMDVLLYFAEDNLAVAYCSNGVGMALNDILIDILSACYNKLFTIPSYDIIELKTEDLDKYLGVYSSDKVSLKITITKNNTTLIAQATGQASFSLKAMENDRFISDRTGIELKFITGKNAMILKQNGGEYLFTRK